MSIIVQFFIAPDDASAALVLPTGPRSAFESLSCGDFDAEDAVIEWESLLTGNSHEALLAVGEPRVIAGQANDGCTVFAISDRLITALASTEQSSLDEVAELWVQLQAEDGDVFDTEIVSEILGDLAGLACRAIEQSHGLYCWVA